MNEPGRANRDPVKISKLGASGFVRIVSDSGVTHVSSARWISRSASFDGRAYRMVIVMDV